MKRADLIMDYGYYFVDLEDSDLWVFEKTQYVDNGFHNFYASVRLHWREGDIVKILINDKSGPELTEISDKCFNECELIDTFGHCTESDEFNELPDTEQTDQLLKVEPDCLLCAKINMLTNLFESVDAGNW